MSPEATALNANDPRIAELAWDKQAGLLPAIVQDAGNGRVLMLGYMDRAALDKTLASGQVTFMPTSRNTVTMPVSWQIGRWPSAHMRELIRIWAIASLAAGDCSRS